jgi:hypothetical protein
MGDENAAANIVRIQAVKDANQLLIDDQTLSIIAI